MSKTIFIRSVTDKAKGAIIAALIIFGFVFFMGTYFPEMQKMGEAYDEMLKNPAMQAIIGSGITSLTTFEGFMAVELFSYMGLILGCYLAFQAASFIAGEIEQKTCDLLLSLPVSREDILVSRFSALIPPSLLIVLALTGGAYMSAMYINVSVNTMAFIYVSIALVALTLSMGAMSMLISTLMSDSKQAALASIGVLVLMYFTETIGSIISGLSPLRALSLFHYADAKTILVSHSISWTDTGVLLAVTAILLGIAVLNFKRRDVNFG